MVDVEGDDDSATPSTWKDELSAPPADDGDPDDREDSDDDSDSDENDTMEDNNKFYPKVPVILPRRRFVGARNVDTVKDGKSYDLMLCPM